MDINQNLHGFVLRYAQPLPEIGATLYRMEYEKNGADLVWLDRPDENKTFSITFKTIPQDDTGVFHILEHSVLNGSDKYPVKEPFVELLKSSLQTFLNAMTFPDKTMYPVSSRNPQDFLNLMDVYMDAVLHPLSIHDPHAFLQEGWHYELEQPEDALICNGVVYSEMKGAYADPDSTLEFELTRALFPDNCYGYESGGYPESIPSLTYENYLASHHRFYHPSNARIFLDGAIDLDATLGKLDSFLQEYDRLDIDADIPFQAPVHPEERLAFYEIDEQDEEENKVLLSKGWVIGTYADKESSLTGTILAELLAGSNEAPICKALLEQELCEDVELQFSGEIQQPYMVLRVRNTRKDAVQKIWQTVDAVLTEQAEKGLDRQHLYAVLNNLEFGSREKDYGTAPRGLIYAILTQESWLYGGDPAQGLCFDEVFASLRQRIESSWYEDYIRSNLLNNPHTAQVVLLPSKTLGEERAAKEAARLEAIKASWTEAQTAQVIETFHKLRARQNTPDSPAQLESLPQLSLSDIPEEALPRTYANISTMGGNTILSETINTNGISYLTLFFSLADIPQERLSEISFLAKLLGQLGTQHYSALQLRSQIQGNLGRFSVAPVVYAPTNQTETCTPYLTITVAVLDSKKKDATRLLQEILLTTRFDEYDLIGQRLRQTRLGIEQEISNSGNAFAVNRIAASFSARGLVTEYFEGIEKLRWIQRSDDAFDSQAQTLCEHLKALCAQLFIRERITVNLTGNWDADWIGQVLEVFPSGTMGTTATYHLRPVSREGFQIPAEVGFAGTAANLISLSVAPAGHTRVAAQYLTYDFLWNAVRVKGGAYGVRLAVTGDGTVRFSSYRDPRTQQSLHTFTEAGAVLRRLADSEDSIDKYIISSIGELQPLLTPRQEGQVAAANYFNGKTEADARRLYSEVLHTDKAQLRQFGDLLDRVCDISGICVIAGKSALKECGELLDSVESIL